MAKKMKYEYSHDDIYNFFEFGIDLERRVIYIGSGQPDLENQDSGVDYLLAEWVIKGIHLLNQSQRKITAVLNSRGGDVCHGWAIYDAITHSRAPIDIKVFGQASSMGSIILQAGRQRLMMPSSLLMIHDGYESSNSIPVRSQEAWVEYGKKDRIRMYKLFSKRSGKTWKHWERRCNFDYILDARDAVREGLADKVL